ncbi:MAG: L-aspartate oxidase [Pseudonocardiaceae bacterium]
MTNRQLSVDLAVVGTGVAGLTAALRAAELGLRVVAVTKTAVDDCNTRWAQGGVAVVLPGSGDSVDAHVADTLAAGGGLCDELAVREILVAGPAAVSALRARGAVFDTGPGGLERAREGGHRAFRVIHAGGDATGAEIERALVGAARGERLPLLAGQPVTEVLRDDAGRVAGLALLGDGAGVLRARAVLLATGGLGQLYALSTNADGATGDGLALALRAGAMTADLEFVQFHPTVLHVGAGSRGRQPLVTEAIRGAGAVLLDTTGSPVMTGVHPLGGLAPRDVVAAAITSRMAQTGTDHVLLDATNLDATRLGGAEFRRRFPTVYTACMALGVDPGRVPIPVAPAAHYQCGGVVTDISGRSTVPGLYAAGELARTGLHGANRLASNSLLEGLVMGQRVAEAVAADLAVSPRPGPPLPPRQVYPVADRDAVRRAMSAHAGIGRDAAGLAAASAVARTTAQRRLRTPRDAEDVGLTLAAAAVLAAASARTESRGCHLRTDHPRASAHWRRAVAVVLDGDDAPMIASPMRVGGVA